MWPVVFIDAFFTVDALSVVAAALTHPAALHVSVHVHGLVLLVHVFLEHAVVSVAIAVACWKKIKKCIANTIATLKITKGQIYTNNK